MKDVLDTRSSTHTPSATTLKAPAELPRLAPWAPVLRRGPGELQIGVGSEAGLVLSGVPEGFEDVLRLADGRHTRIDLLGRAIADEIEPALIDDVLATLQAAGLIMDQARSGPIPAPGDLSPAPLSGIQLRLVGAGQLGSAIARAALRAGVDRLFVADNDPVDPTVHHHPGLATSQAEGLAAALSRPGEDRQPILVVDHWSKPERRRPTLTVIATDYAEPDPSIGQDFVDGHHPHLYLRPSQGGAVVGPFVRPGATPCLRCIDLTRRDADPAWPTMLPQLCRTTLPVTPLLASWAAVTAITQIVAVRAGRRASTLAGTVELTPQQSEPQFRRWPVHPRCGCGESTAHDRGRTW